MKWVCKPLPKPFSHAHILKSQSSVLVSPIESFVIAVTTLNLVSAEGVEPPQVSPHVYSVLDSPHICCVRPKLVREERIELSPHDPKSCTLPLRHSHVKTFNRFAYHTCSTVELEKLTPPLGFEPRTTRLIA